jgi:hypothetical protein
VARELRSNSSARGTAGFVGEAGGMGLIWRVCDLRGRGLGILAGIMVTVTVLRDENKSPPLNKSPGGLCWLMVFYLFNSLRDEGNIFK